MDLKKKLKIFSFVLLGVLLLGYLALFVTVKMFFPSHRLKETIAQRLSDSLERKVEIGEAGVSVFPRLRLDAERVRIANPENFSDTAFVKISKLSLDVKLLPLLSRQIDVASIVLDRPEVFIEKSRSGAFNFASEEAPHAPPPPDESTEGSPVSLLINSARIVDGRISYVDHQKHSSAEVRGIDEDLTLSFD
ncbi:MAG: AsmA family protein, partial [Calditrichaeota bacterium]